MKKLIILGSTGSIGTQALDCVAMHPELFKVTAISVGKNIDLAEKQIRAFAPDFAAVADEEKAIILSERVSDLPVKVFAGSEGILRLLDEAECDIVLNGIVGMAGMMSTYKAVNKGMTVALANKESLVVAGSIIMKDAAKHNAHIIPVDSEHSAIFQSLNGIVPTKDDLSEETKSRKLKKIILTASGGAFFGLSEKELKHMRPQDALNHPNWNMGSKITVDCATMFNKGFEIIEAMHIFGLPLDKIEVVIHRESVIHSMIEFCDNSVIAQLALPDMRTAIQYALTYPEREPSPVGELDFAKIAKLSFYDPDARSKRAMDICRDAQKCGGTMTAVLNAANECAVKEFLNGEISFTDITDKVESALERHCVISRPTIDQIISADAETRAYFR